MSARRLVLSGTSYIYFNFASINAFVGLVLTNRNGHYAIRGADMNNWRGFSF